MRGNIMTRISLIVLFLVVIVVVGLVGSHFGFTVNGVPQSTDGITLTGFLGFIMHLATFTIDNVPAILSAGFLIMQIIIVILGLSFLLPGGGG